MTNRVVAGEGVTGVASVAVMNEGLFAILLKKIGVGITILFLIFLPFQQNLSKWLNLSKVLWVDEFIVSVAFTLFLLILLYLGRIVKVGARILLCLLILGVVGILSGLINNNGLLITINGTFDYLKNFLLIPIFCLLSIQRKNAERAYFALNRLALFLCLVAIGQEIAFFAGLPLEKVFAIHRDYRIGLLRTPSLMGHPNIFGLYALLFFILDFSIHRRMRWQNFILMIGVFLSLSRMVWVAFLAGLFLLLIQGKSRKMVGLFTLVALIMAVVIPLFYVQTSIEIGSENYFRGYTFSKSMEIWKDHPIFGVGPGMYGGVVSFFFNSPVYEQYNFSKRWLEFSSSIHSLDQFWGQLLAEMGVLGTIIFLVLIYLLWKVPLRASVSKEDVFLKRMLSGLSVISISLFAYLFGSSLNLTAFLLTYSALFGLYLGGKDESSTD